MGLKKIYGNKPWYEWPEQHRSYDPDAVTDPEALSRRISDRHFGIGADGLVLICPSDKADAFMRMFNADGSEGRMCPVAMPRLTAK